MRFACLVFLVCYLVEVHSQIAPYVSFMSQTLANHSYVDLSLVDDTSGSDSLQCHTDLPTCCGSAQGSHRGDWYFPNGNRLQFNDDIYETHELTYVVGTVPPHQLVSIAVRFQLMLSMMMMTVYCQWR